MKTATNHGPTFLKLSTTTLLVFGSALALTLALGACSSETEDGGAGGGQTASEPEEALTIAPEDGWKYYVGGPAMKADKYGRMRVENFNGEVKNPTSRGLVIGFKSLEDKRFQFRTWLNGRLITESDGFLDEQGLHWYDERLTFNKEGKVIVRQTLKYDDEAQIMNSTIDHLDPADGEILKTVVSDLPYSPDYDDEDEEEDEAEQG